MADQVINKAMLVLPRLRVQNANTVSSPLTWGFPSITAFTGLMVALERRLGANLEIKFHGVGVICHQFEPQATNGYTRKLHLTRNPLKSTGKSQAIVEEGRAHLDITLMFDVEIPLSMQDLKRAELANTITDVVAGMRIAGGSVIPSSTHTRPLLTPVSEDTEKRRNDFLLLTQNGLLGYALVSRDDILQTRFEELISIDPETTLLDAWLDLSRINYRAVKTDNGETEFVEWTRTEREGWIVPIPVGFAAISKLYDPNTVTGTRDPQTPFRFVESVYSMGQWINPSRLTDTNNLFWYPSYEPSVGLYRCFNQYQPRS